MDHLDHGSERAAPRRGNYSMVMASLATVLVGFGALSVDLSVITMSQLQIQATADAAAHAAMATFRKDFDPAKGEEAARFVVRYNEVGMGVADLAPGYPEYGTYDYDLRTFTPGQNSDGSANGVRVRLTREGTNAVDLLLAPMLGVESANVAAEAITAQQMRAIFMVNDMSGSMMDRYESNNPDTTDAVAQARLANLAFVDYMMAHPLPGDMLGLSMFAQWAVMEPTPAKPYGEKTNDFLDPSVLPWLPLTPVIGNEALITQRVNGICHTIRDTWTREPYPQPCPYSGEVHPEEDEIGGCTNHEPALGMAITQLEALTDESYFRGIVLFSDGLPSCSIYGTDRAWAAQRALAQADRAWAADISIWSLLYRNGIFDTQFMQDMVRGVGFYAESPDPADLDEMYEEVARAMPMGLVF